MIKRVESLFYLSSMILQNVSTVIVPIIRLLPQANSLQEKKSFKYTRQKENKYIHTVKSNSRTHSCMVHQDTEGSTIVFLYGRCKKDFRY
jgi:hypothetical protein